ncbi:MAG: metallophosphoesterase [Gemmataceae bacterium]|nr:metallophosphoesterase [Gemmataceae bacterium]
MTTPPLPVRVAVTADLHYGGRHAEGTAAAHALAAELYHDPPDLLVLAGDVGAGDDFARCLDLFADLPARKALVPGNHDIWVRPDDPRGDSLAVYREYLPRVAADHDFHYLDAGPLVLPEAGLAVVGSINWYDYSWGRDRLAALGVPDWRDRLAAKRFVRGRHNDANFVRWESDDARFTRQCVATLAGHLRQALRQVPAALLVTHHPMVRGLNYPKPDPPDLDALLWECFSGNEGTERLLAEFTGRVPVAVCGHTHFARDGVFGRTRGYNVGGDYHFKRLLRFDWPAGQMTAAEFTGAGEQVA